MEDWRSIRCEQEEAYLEGLKQDIETERREALNQFHTIIAEAWRLLPPKSKSLVRLYQQSVSRPDPEIRKLFQMSDKEMEILHSLSNSHLFSSSITCCRNVSDVYVRAMQMPCFTELDSDIVLCFDAASSSLRWTNLGSISLARVKIPIQLGDSLTEEMEIPLSLEESQLLLEQHNIISTKHRTPKRMDLEADDSTLAQAAQRLCLEEEQTSEQWLLEEQMREWDMDLD